MALYLISYDVAQKDVAEYIPLWDKLKALGAIKILYSEWVLVDEIKQAVTIYNQIAPLTTQSDRLLVQELTKDAMWDKLLISDEKFNELLLSARG